MKTNELYADAISRGLDICRAYPADGRIVYHLYLDDSPDDLDADENPTTLDVETWETIDPQSDACADVSVRLVRVAAQV